LSEDTLLDGVVVDAGSTSPLGIDADSTSPLGVDPLLLPVVVVALSRPGERDGNGTTGGAARPRETALLLDGSSEESGRGTMPSTSAFKRPLTGEMFLGDVELIGDPDRGVPK